MDLDGQLVGINTMIQTAGYSEGNIGISFAIPANLAMTVANAIIQDGSWKRPWIGIMMEEAEQGVAVARVVPEGPADKAGLRAGDRITAVNQVPAENSRSVQRAILGGQAGAQVTITVERAGKAQDISIRTEAMPMPDRLFRE